jgi:hypothetical protein
VQRAADARGIEARLRGHLLPDAVGFLLLAPAVGRQHQRAGEAADAADDAPSMGLTMPVTAAPSPVRTARAQRARWSAPSGAPATCPISWPRIARELVLVVREREDPA